jgi:hypothetical protein
MSGFGKRAYEPEHGPHAVAERLRAVMKIAGMKTRLDLVEAIGATEPHVWDWLDARYLPPAELMLRLANMNRVTLEYIYYGDESGLRPKVIERLHKAAERLARARAYYEFY